MDNVQELISRKTAGSIYYSAGQVEVINSDGVRRKIEAGDTVFQNEVVITGVDGVIHINLIDGRMLQLGNSEEADMSSLLSDFLIEDGDIEFEAEQVEVTETEPTEDVDDGGFGSQNIQNLSGIEVDPSAGFSANSSGLISTTNARSPENDLIALDTTPPTSPTVALQVDSGINGDFSTNNGALALSDIEAGATVEYSIDGGLTWQTDFTPVEGLNQVQIRQSDAAGNISTSSSIEFTLDQTPSAAPGVALTTDTGIVGDNITRDGGLSLSGVEAGATVEYSTDGGLTWQTDFTPVEGLNQVQIRQSDAAGNASTSSSIAFTLDQTPGAAPGVALAKDTGTVGDNITRKGGLQLSGVEAGATVEYSIDDGKTWQTDFTAVEGLNQVQVRQTDAVGNISTSSSIAFTLDQTPGATPEVALATDTGIVGDNITSDGGLSLSGVEAGATVEYSTDDGKTWQTDFTPVEGLNQVQIRQSDAAGNASESNSFDFTLDTSADTDDNLSVTVDSVINNGEKTEVSSTLSGVDSDAKTVVVTYTDKKGGEVRANATYNDSKKAWEVEQANLSSLADGEIAVRASVTDQAGNEKTDSTDLTLDTSADSDDKKLTVKVDSVINNGEKTNVSSTLSGVDSDAKTVVVIYTDKNDKKITANATYNDSKTAWEVEQANLSSLADGEIVVSASVTDQAGNKKTDSTDLTLDTSADSDNNLSVTVDTVINNGEKTEVSSTLSGVDSDAKTVVVTYTDKKGGEVRANATYNDSKTAWEVEQANLSSLADGEIAVRASVTDQAGNEKTDSTDLTLDTSADSDNNLSVTVDSVINNGEKTNVSSTLSGVDSDAKTVVVTYTDKNDKKITANATYNDSKKAWEVGQANLSSLADGEISVSAKVTDTAGNSKTVAAKLTLDTSADSDNNLSVTVDTVINNGEKTNVSSTLSGVDSDAKTVVVTYTDKKGGEVRANATYNDSKKAWEVEQANLSSLADGEIAVRASVTDQAGNEKTDSTDLTLDTSADSDNNLSVTVDSVINNGEKTNVSSTLSGVDSDAKTVVVTYTDKNDKKITANATYNDSKKAWEVGQANLSSLADGEIVVSASVTDQAGNEKTDSTDLTLDTSADSDNNLSVTVDTVINNGEKTEVSSTLSGVDSDAKTVVVTYTDKKGGEVLANATYNDSKKAWEVEQANLSSLADGEIAVRASVTDQAGNEKTDSTDLTLDTSADSDNNLSVTVDSVINNGEKTNVSSTLSGVDSDAKTVVVTYTDKNDKKITVNATYNDSKKAWEVGQADLSALADGEIAVRASVTDQAGNEKTDSTDLTLDTSADSDNNLSVTVDSVINNGEKTEVSSTLSGVDSDAKTVVVTYTDKNDKKITANATYNDSKKAWEVEQANLSSLADGEIAVRASVTDQAGNEKTDSTDLTLDTSADSDNNLSVTVDTVINNGEKTNVSSTLSGVDSDAKTVVVTYTDKNDKKITANATYNDSKKAWEVEQANLSSLADGEIAVSASVTDQAGNEKTDSTDLTLDTSADSDNNLSVTVDSVINNGEKTEVSSTLSGVDSDAKTVVVIYTDKNDKKITANATYNDSKKAWEVEQANLSSLADGEIAVRASVTDQAGNETTDSTDLTLDTSADSDNNLSVTVDSVINNGEKTNVSSTLSGVDSDAKTVVVTYTDKKGGEVRANATYNDSKKAWEVEQANLSSLADGEIAVSVSVTDQAGNEKTDSTDLTLDTSADSDNNLSVTVDSVINNGEKTEVSSTLSGVDSDAKTVVVTYTDKNDKKITANATYNDSKKAWEVEQANLSSLADGEIAVSVSVTDQAGNETTDSTDLTLDTSADSDNNLSVTVDTVINNAGKTQVISTLSGVDSDAKTVVVTYTDKDGKEVLANTTYDAINKQWKVEKANLSSLADGEITVSAKVTDTAGNSKTVAAKLTLDTSADTDDNLSVTVDTVINNAGKTKVISTLSGVDSDADTVAVTFTDKDGKEVPANTTYDAINKQWKVEKADLSALADGEITVSAKVTDTAGNSKTVAAKLTLDTSADTDDNLSVTVDTVINNAGKTKVISTLSGVDSDADTVAVTYTDKDGKEVPANTTYDAINKQWKVEKADLSALADGEITVSAKVTDTAGNSKTVAAKLTLDTSADTDDNLSVTVDPVINDAGKTKVISTLSGVDSDADTVAVTYTDKDGKEVPANTTYDAINKQWKVEKADLSALADGEITVSAKVTDTAGNSKTVAAKLTLDTSADSDDDKLTVKVDPVINNAGKTKVISTLSGVDSDADTVAVTFTDKNDKKITANATYNDSKKAWEVGQANLSSLADGEIRVSAKVTDTAGNSKTVAAKLTLDTSADSDDDKLTVKVDPVINNAGKTKVISTLSGVDSDADTVAVTFTDKNDKKITANATYNDSKKAWEVGQANLSSLADGEIRVSAKVTDTAGNSKTVAAKLTLDTSADSDDDKLTVKVDSVINNAGKTQVISTLSGVDSDAKTVVVTYTDKDGKEVPANTTYDAINKQWKVEKANLSSLADGEISVSAKVTDTAGNSKTVAAKLTLDTSADSDDDKLTVKVDSVINNAGKTQVISTLSGVDSDADTVAVTFTDKDGKEVPANTTYDAINKQWKVEKADLSALADGKISVSAKVMDKAGNKKTELTNFTLDTSADSDDDKLTVKVDSVINNAGKTQVISTLSGVDSDAKTVVVTYTDKDGKEVPANTTYDAINKQWKVEKADLSALADGKISVSAKVMDKAGNKKTELTNFTLDTSADSDANKLTVKVDSVINDAGKTKVISTLSGVDSDADTVAVTYTDKDGKEVPANTTYDAINKQWKVEKADLSSLADGEITVSAKVTDTAGNSKTVAAKLTLDTSADTDDNLSVTVDPVINNAGKTKVISTLSGVDSDADTVAVTFTDKDGKEVPANTTYDAINKQWKVEKADLSSLADGEITVSAKVTDTAGNSKTVAAKLTLDTSADSDDDKLTVKVDSVINDAGKTKVISTLSGVDSDADTVAVTFTDKDGKEVPANTTYDAINKQWKVEKADLSALADGKITVSAKVTDTAGNSKTVAAKLTLDTSADTDDNLSVTVDTVINNAGKTKVISTLSGVDSDADTVAVTFTDKDGKEVPANTTYDAINKQWKVEKADLSALADGEITVSAKVTDTAGNSKTVAAKLTLDTSADTDDNLSVTVDTVINNAGKTKVISTLSGVDSDADTVAVTFTDKDGKEVPANTTYDAINKQWKVEKADLSALADGEITVSAKVTDTAGNSKTVAAKLTLDTSADTDDNLSVTVDPVINDAGKTKVISTLSGVDSDADTVAVTYTDKDGKEVPANTTYDAINKQWKVEKADLSALADGEITVSAKVTDTAGNSKTVAAKLTLDTSADTDDNLSVTVDPVINDAGKTKVISTLSGVDSDADTVAVTYTDKDGKEVPANTTYDAINKQWKVEKADLSALADGEITVSAKVTDTAGNSKTVAAKLTLDTSADSDDDKLTVKVDPVINNAGKTKVISTLSGVDSDAKTVVVTYTDKDGKEVPANTTYDAINKQWKVEKADLSALADGKISVSAKVMDKAGNKKTELTNFTLDTSADSDANKLTVKVDSVINDAGKTKVISTLSGVDSDADTVAVTYTDKDGKEVPANTTYDAINKQWKVEKADLSSLADGEITVSAKVTDTAGNSKTVAAKLTLDTSADTDDNLSVTVDPVINNAGKTKVISTLSGVDSDADTVAVTFTDKDGKEVPANTTYDAINKQWKVEKADLSSLADGEITVSAKVTDTAGNSKTVAAKLTLDTSADSDDDKLTVKVDSVINDAGKTKVISTLSGVDSDADTVAVTFTDKDGKEVPANTTYDAINKQWKVEKADLSALADGKITVSAKVTDTAGNSKTVAAKLTLDTSADTDDNLSVTVDTVINNAGKTKVISTLSGVDSDADTVAVTFTDKDGKEVPANTTYDAINKQWKVEKADLSALADGKITVSAKVTDTAGNSKTVAAKLTLDTSADTDDNLSVTVDPVINDAGKTKVISTLSGVDSDADTVAVTFTDKDGKEVPANTTYDAINKQWKVEKADLSSLADGEITVSAKVTDTAGNSKTVAAKLTLDTSADSDDDKLTVKVDSVINDAGKTKVISTLSGVDSDADTVAVTFTDKDGKEVPANTTYDAINKQWKVEKADLSALADGKITVSAKVTDTAGNSKTVAAKLTLDTSADTDDNLSVTVDTVINNAGKTKVISTLSGVDSDADTVAVTFTDKDGKEVPANTTYDAINKQWKVEKADLSALADGKITVSAKVTDTAGNSKTVAAKLTLDTSADTDDNLSVTVDTVINNAGKTKVISTLSGVDSDADTVAVTFTDKDGKEVPANTTYDAINKQWKVEKADLSALADGKITVSAKVTDTAGNSKTVAAKLTLDTSADTDDNLSVTVDTVINNAGKTKVISTLSGVDSDADTVAVTFTDKDGKEVPANTTYDAINKQWKVEKADLSALADGEITVSAKVTDTAGNSKTVAAKLTLDTSADSDDDKLTVKVDPVINNAGKTKVISTLSGVDSDADTVAVTFTDKNDKKITANATYNDSKKAWEVGQANLSSLADGEIRVSAKVTDTAGNSKTVAAKLTLDTSADSDDDKLTVKVDPVINNAGKTKVISTLSGVDSDADTVAVTFTDKNDKKITANATYNDSKKAWEVGQANLSSLADGEIAVRASVTDQAGNEKTDSTDLTLDTSADSDNNLSVTVDSVINNGEKTEVSSTLSGVDSDAKTVVVIYTDKNDKKITANATYNDSKKEWEVEQANLSSLADGEIAVRASVTDQAGNETTDSTDLTLDTSADSDNNLSVTVDSVINNGEKTEVSSTLSGVDSDAKTVVVTYTDKNDKKITANATYNDSKKEWEVEQANLSSLADGEIAVSASVTDQAGNEKTDSTDLTLDTSADSDNNLSVTVDSVINNGEKTKVSSTLSGVDSDAKTVVVTYTDKNDKKITANATYNDSKKAWEVEQANLSSLADGEIAVSASVTDQAGNETTDSTDLTLDTSADSDNNLSVTVDSVINNDEKTEVSSTLSGVDSDAKTVVVIYTDKNDKKITANATYNDSKKAWEVEQANLSSLADGEIAVRASVTDQAGNEKTDSTDLTLDTSADSDNNLSVTVDSVINNDEKTEVSSTLSGVDSDAKTVVVIYTDKNDKKITANATYNDSKKAWEVEQANLSSLADGEIAVRASVTDQAGNEKTDSTDLTLDTSADSDNNLSVTVDSVINNGEKTEVSSTLSGVDSDAKTVVVTYTDKNDKKITANATYNDSKKAWEVEQANLSSLADGEIAVSASVTDQAGNEKTDSTDLTLDTSADSDNNLSVTVDSVINNGEKTNVSSTLNGVDSDAKTVVVIYTDKNDKKITANATYNDSKKAWEVEQANLSSLADGEIAVSVSVTDQAGNETTDSTDLTLDTSADSDNNLSVTVDSVINNGEKTKVSSTLSGVDSDAKTVVVTYTDKNDKKITANATYNDSKKAWEVGQANLSSLADGDIAVSAKVTDTGGNSKTVAAKLTLDTSADSDNNLSVTVDTVINNAGKTQVISTLSGVDSDAKTVVVTFTDKDGKEVPANTTYDAINKQWKVEKADLSALADGEITVSAKVTDTAGNSKTVAAKLTLDTSADSDDDKLTVKVDSVINDAGKTKVISTLSGVDSDADTVAVTYTDKDGKEVPANTTYDAINKQWKVEKADLSSLADGEITVSAKVTDTAGNSKTVAAKLTLDTSADTDDNLSVTVDTVINNAGKTKVISTLSGVDSDADTVAVTYTDKDGKEVPANTTYDAINKQWKVEKADLSSLADGEITVSAKVTDTAGNSKTVAAKLTLDTSADTDDNLSVTVDTVINNAGKTKVISTLSGVDSDADTVAVTYTDKDGKEVPANTTYDAINKQWKVEKADLSALADGKITVSAKVTDTAGNSKTVAAKLTLDTSADSDDNLTVRVDSVINGAGKTKVISTLIGVDSDAKTVVVTYTDKDDNTVIVNATENKSNKQWEVGQANLSSLADGEITVSAKVTDTAGNSKTVAAKLTLDTSADSDDDKLTVKVDSVINDAGKTKVISTLSGVDSDAKTVVVTFTDKDGKEVPANTTYDAINKQWKVEKADLSSLADGEITVSAKVTDTAGNSKTVAAKLTLDTSADSDDDKLTVKVDSVINDAGKTKVISTLSGVDSDAKTVVVTFTDKDGKEVPANTTYDAINKQWKVEKADLSALADGEITVSAKVTDTAGNSKTVAAKLTLDTSADSDNNLSVTVDTVINNAGKTQVISTLSGVDSDAKTVVVTFTDKDGKEVPANTTYDAINKQWKVEKANLSSLADGEITVSAKVTDTAGNSKTVAAKLTLDTSADTDDNLSVTVDTVINNAGKTKVISTLSGVDSDADTVAVTFTDKDGKEVPANTTYDAINKQWKVEKADLSALADGKITVSAKVTDTAGNSKTVAAKLTLDTSADSDDDKLTVKVDSVINDAGKTKVISTLSGVDSDADTVAVTFTDKDGKEVPANTTYDAINKQWKVEKADLSALADGKITVSAKVTDTAGNSKTVAAKLTLDTSADSDDDKLTVKVDSVINDAGKTKVISTLSGVDSDADTVAVTFTDKDGKEVPANTTYDAINKQWKVEKADLSSLADGEITVSAKVTDTAGNSKTVAAKLTLDTSADTDDNLSVTVDTVINNAGKTKVISTLSGVDSDADTVAVTYTDKDGKEVPANTTYDAINKQWKVEKADLSALADGKITVSAKVTDTAGNSKTVAAKLTLDTSADSDNNLSVTVAPVINDDGKTKVITTLSGVDSDADTVAVTFTDKNDKKITANATYNDSKKAWEVEQANLSSLADGEIAVSASVTDQAGNETTDSTDLTLDTSLSTPTMELNKESDSGDSSDQITSVKKPVFELGVDPDVNKVVVLVETTKDVYVELAGDAVKTDGSWSFTPKDDLPDDTYKLKVQVTDVAGNIETSESPLKVVIDTQVVKPTVNSQETPDTTPIITGTAQLAPGDILEVTVSDATYTVKTDKLGNWSLDLESAVANAGTSLTALEDGKTYEVVALVRDVAGNKVADSTKTELTINKDAPVLPTVNSLLADTDTPTLTGTAELSVGQYLTVTVNNKTYFYDPTGSITSTVAYDNASKIWELKIPEGDKLPEGTYNVEAKVSSLSSDSPTLEDITKNELAVDTTPEAPLIYVTTKGTSLYSDFEGFDIPAKGWSGDIKAGFVGFQTDNKNGTLEIGRETVYGGSNGNNHVMELKAFTGDYNIYSDIKSIKGEVLQFTFDHSERDSSDSREPAIESAIRVKVYDLDADGNVIKETLITTITPPEGYGLKTYTFYFAASGESTRFEILADQQTDTTGAIIDNIRVKTVGYQRSAEIPLNIAASTLKDTEALELTVSGIPKGVTLTDGEHTFTATVNNATVDISNWTFANITLKPALDFVGNVPLTFTAVAEDQNGDSSSSKFNFNYKVFPDVLPTNRNEGDIGNNTIDGTESNDAINGLTGNDTLQGAGGDDILSGDEGDDVINGGSGKDFIDGGEGDDVLTGGAGSDLFIFKIDDLLDGKTVQTDTLTDFTLGKGANADFLDISGLIDFGANETIDLATLLEKGVTATYEDGKARIEFTKNTQDGDGDKLIIVFANTDADSDTDATDVLNQLIQNGQLIV